MNGSEVRKFIKQGEQATEVLNKLGYTYSDKQGEHPHWVAPEKPMDNLKAALEALIKVGIEEGVEAHKEALKKDPRGPNWHLVEQMVGRNFKVRMENIPIGHSLRTFGYSHFSGRVFRAESIEYRRDPSYTGYAVNFTFATRPYRPETVWLPLSCAAFQN
jgi:hypothetical protein